MPVYENSVQECEKVGYIQCKQRAQGWLRQRECGAKNESGSTCLAHDCNMVYSWQNRYSNYSRFL